MLNSDFRDILSAFNAERVEYLVVGAYALAAHGLPRATGDIDLWIRRSPENAERVWRALAEFGAPLDQLSRSELTAPDIVIQIGVAPRRIDVLTSIDGVEFDQAWGDRVIVSVDGITIPVIGRRHLAETKRAAGRPQDLADVRRLEAGER
jgi:hypothetical protein